MTDTFNEYMGKIPMTRLYDELVGLYSVHPTEQASKSRRSDSTVASDKSNEVGEVVCEWRTGMASAGKD